MLTACIRNLFAWLARRHVSKGRSNSHGVVTQKPECGIAAGAEKAAHGASLMVVIYSQALLYACDSLGYAQPLADRAASALSFKQRVVLGWLNAKTFLAASIRTKPVVLLPVFLAPLRLLVASARLAKTLKAIDLTACLKELGLVLHRFASAAPFHPFGGFRAAGCASVVPLQVVQRFSFDPPQVLSVPGCNWRWSATSALAQAFRYFGHHASPSLAGFANNIRGKK